VKDVSSPEPLIIRFTVPDKTESSSSYPGGNFGGNQLLDGTFFFTKAYNYNQSIDSVVNRNICCKHIVLCVVT
jgi:hypothetical protein